MIPYRPTFPSGQHAGPRLDRVLLLLDHFSRTTPLAPPSSAKRRASASAPLVEPGSIGPGLSPMILVPIGRGHRPGRRVDRRGQSSVRTRHEPGGRDPVHGARPLLLS